MKKEANILAIDDNQTSNFITKSYFERTIAEINIVVKNSGEEALHYLVADDSPKPDLILLDIIMPEMDGFEFLDTYQKISRKTKVIMLTGSENQTHRDKAAQYSCIVDYIKKPLDINAIKAIKEKYLEERED